MARRRDEPRSLGRGDASGGAAIVVAAALSHLHENECGALAGDEIYFAEAAPVVALRDDETALAQKPQ